jgi:putative DNA methylase
LPAGSVDLIVTDPPFFDNVHYSELADFFQAWRPPKTAPSGQTTGTTRHPAEVQDTDGIRFARKLQAVFGECHRILKDGGLLVFTYHHSRNEGWKAVAEAILGAGFSVVNSHPVKAEMSVATPKARAKEPIQLDIIIVCRKAETLAGLTRPAVPQALDSARAKLARLQAAGFTLSRNDRRIVICGQLLTTFHSANDAHNLEDQVEEALDAPLALEPVLSGPRQRILFDAP